MSKLRFKGNLIVDIGRGHRAQMLFSAGALFRNGKKGSRFRRKYLIAVIVCVGPILSALIQNTS